MPSRKKCFKTFRPARLPAPAIRQKNRHRLTAVGDDYPCPSPYPCEISRQSITQVPDTDRSLHFDPRGHKSVTMIYISWHPPSTLRSASCVLYSRGPPGVLRLMAEPTVTWMQGPVWSPGWCETFHQGRDGGEGGFQTVELRQQKAAGRFDSQQVKSREISRGHGSGPRGSREE